MIEAIPSNGATTYGSVGGRCMCRCLESNSPIESERGQNREEVPSLLFRIVVRKWLVMPMLELHILKIVCLN